MVEGLIKKNPSPKIKNIKILEEINVGRGHLYSDLHFIQKERT